MKPAVLTRYRVMAFATGVMLLVLSTCMVFKYGFDTGKTVTLVVSQLHGLLYIVYVVCAFDLGTKVRWPLSRLLWVLVAGTLPFSFLWVEPRVTREVSGRLAAAGEGEGPKTAYGA